MNRFKRHKVKAEKPEKSTSSSAPANDFDLTYYVHDRVELMHQVFSVLKPKDLKAMAPECVRHISIDDLQELCTEELLGISSKRLCAIIDGADPPSDTESSSASPERLETISLDSISSDDDILSVGSSRKSKKHKRHHRDKGKSKKKKSKDNIPDAVDTGFEEQSRATRAGLTVLELLELQARARAIRAQLQQEQAARQGAASGLVESNHLSSDNEVEIKEEPAEVVEISSEDEKPSIEELRASVKSSSKESNHQDSQAVTKRINDLVITVPQTKQSRKIKLNRTKITVSVPNTDKTATVSNSIAKTINKTVVEDTASRENSNVTSKTNVVSDENPSKDMVKSKEKKKKKKSKKAAQEKDSDHDEITLQLSDTEKMDLLEDLDRKNFEIVSSSGSEDSESSSSSSSDDERNDDDKAKTMTNKDKKQNKSKGKDVEANKVDDSVNEAASVGIDSKVNGSKSQENSAKESSLDNKEPSPQPLNVSNQDVSIEMTKADSINTSSPTNDISKSAETNDVTKSTPSVHESKDTGDKESLEKNIEVAQINDIPVLEDDSARPDCSAKELGKDTGEGDGAQVPIELNKDKVDPSNETKSDKEGIQQGTTEKEMSDGELSDRESSEVEAFEVQPEVVCISDTEETDKKKKKKKKEKKSKSKKSKKTKSDFRESCDQNFFEEAERVDMTVENTEQIVNVDKTEDTATLVLDREADTKIDDKTDRVLEKVVVKTEDTSSSALAFDEDYDDVYEILELSDDSSCYEVEGTVLSKEPTAQEIEALSAKIDEIEREDVVTEEEIKDYEERLKKADEEDVENISWKDRYLDSNKVKKVLTTSNIFNALRKKNRELKRKLEDSKKQQVLPEPVEQKELVQEEIIPNLEEGSIEHYNALQGSTKYVAPVNEEDNTDGTDNKDQNGGTEDNNGDGTQNGGSEAPVVVKEMRKDAKQLLKMYKRLLKYNDINKKKDPNKKKKKKIKKKVKAAGGPADVTSA